VYRFEITEAKILHDVIFNNENVFLVIEAKNGKYYQIKLPTYFSNPVTKEFLANYIGQILNFPVPNSAFVRLSKNFLSELLISYPEILEKVSNLNWQQYKDYINDYYNSTLIIPMSITTDNEDKNTIFYRNFFEKNNNSKLNTKERIIWVFFV
jgi:hypothetical protein